MQLGKFIDICPKAIIGVDFRPHQFYFKFINQKLQPVPNKETLLQFGWDWLNTSLGDFPGALL